MFSLLLTLFALLAGVFGGGGTARGLYTYPVQIPTRDVRPGDVIRFDRPVRVLVVQRLECPNDVHRIRLGGARSWRVPDLPEGEYDVYAASGEPELILSSHNHAAPCPAP